MIIDSWERCVSMRDAMHDDRNQHRRHRNRYYVYIWIWWSKTEMFAEKCTLLCRCRRKSQNGQPGHSVSYIRHASLIIVYEFLMWDTELCPPRAKHRKEENWVMRADCFFSASSFLPSPRHLFISFGSEDDNNFLTVFLFVVCVFFFRRGFRCCVAQ